MNVLGSDALLRHRTPLLGTTTFNMTQSLLRHARYDKKIVQDVWERLLMKQVVKDVIKASSTNLDYQVNQNASTQLVLS